MVETWRVFNRPVAGSCEHDNELRSSIQGGEFLDCLSDC